MASRPPEEEPGFENDVNELPDDTNASEDALDDEPLPEDDEMDALEEAQEDAADERQEGGYQ